MSRITKQIANDVTRSLMREKNETLKSMKNEFSEMVRNQYLKGIPKEIQEFFEKHRGFAKNSCTVYLTAHGFNRKNVSIKEAPGCMSHPSISLDAKTGDKLFKFDSKIETMNKENDELFTSIENALLNLKTFKAVEKEFPEAVPFLPKYVGVSTALVVNLSSIREKLK